MDFTIFTEGLKFPEGPVWLDDGSIIVVEIAAGRITRCKKDGSIQTIATPGGGPNGAAFGPKGQLFVCNNGGFEWSDYMGMLVSGHAAKDNKGGRIEIVDINSGKVDRLYDVVEGHHLSGPNDIVFDAHGGFYFTDLGQIHEHHKDHGGLFYGKADGSGIKRVAYPVGSCNGVGLSPDGKTVYVALTYERAVVAFDIIAPGVVAESLIPALPGRVVTSFPARQMLDSLAITADGSICVATLVDTPGIAEIDPATGKYTHFPFPDLLTTNIAFGGIDMCDAAIMLSSTGKIALTKWHKPGLKLAPQLRAD
jgi:gluconolactonase